MDWARELAFAMAFAAPPRQLQKKIRSSGPARRYETFFVSSPIRVDAA
jgi:hypothetical protein